jgi:hypothetical protein
MMEPVPVQDVARLSASAALKVMQGPELRTIFLGMDQSRNELLFSNVKGKNPFKDKRVTSGLLSGDRCQRDPEGGDARRQRADGPDDRARHQGLSGGSEQAPAVMTRRRRRSCWPTPAIRKASRSA